MKTYLQYFNVEKMGRYPNGADALLTRRLGVFTKLPAVQESKGGTIFVIVGLGKPKRYYLWESFTIEDVQKDGEQFVVSGPGWVLLPPQLLEGKDFDKFKASCANFVGFRAIDELPYCPTLRQIADRHHGTDVTPACETFCDELVKLEPKNGDSFYYRGTVRQRLGKRDAAKEDFARALTLGTNFPTEAEAAMTAPTAAPTAAPAKDKLTGQVLAKGVFAQGAAKKPANVADTAWRTVLQRRGQEDLRQKLIAAYGGRCAVTGCDGEAALEVALIGDDAADVRNALLLRGDIRTLFELNLIRVHPKTKKLFVAEALRKCSYGRLAARQLRLPEKKDDRPSFEALSRRWEAAGGDKGA